VWLANTEREKVAAKDGSNIVLTIDHTLQFKLEELLARLASEYKTKAALGILMDPKTGEVFAMASNPSFNLNEYNKVKDIQIYRNPLVSNLYEQGSIFKPITIGIGLDKQLITPQTIYKDIGETTINGFTIKNALEKPYGEQTLTFALEQSLNMGMIFVQQKIGNIPFMEALRDKFKLAEKTGIDLTGEVAGNINNITKSSRDARDVNYATASFGQGISFTPIKMLTAFNAIVNEGKMIKPRLVKEIIASDGNITRPEPEVYSEVMSPESARQLSEMLVSVVDNGGGKKASVEGYSIGGKTGTAQIAGIGGYTDDTYQSFIEFATLDNTRYTLLISLDSPQGSKFSDVSVVPNIKEFNQFLLNYFEIQPDRIITE
jgi:cell division protein FtsI/penicillin-binding protein 2